MEDTSKYEIIKGKKFRRKVRAIIVDQKKKFLLVQPKSYPSHSWSFVGGGVEVGESEEVAIIREIREEVGIEKVISLAPSKEREKYIFSEKIKAARKADYDGQITSIFFIQIQEAFEVKVQVEEIKDYQWASLDEVRKLVVIPELLTWFESTIEELWTGEVV